MGESIRWASVGFFIRILRHFLLFFGFSIFGFRKHKNASVRYALVHWGSSSAVTSKVLKALSKDKDFDIAKEAKKTLEWR